MDKSRQSLPEMEFQEDMQQLVVFFDDTRANVDGALACGWSAHLTRGTGELRKKLVALDLV